MLVSHREAEYRGRRYEIVFYGNDWHAVARGDAPLSEFPDALEVGSNNRLKWVKLPTSLISRWRVGVTAEWKGERVAVVGQKEHEGMVGIDFAGDPQKATALGIPGSQFEGWHHVVPVAELSDVEVHEEMLR